MDNQYIKNRTEEVIKKSAVVTNLDDFLATHVPFEKLKYFTSGIRNHGETYYTEEALFNKFIMENRSKHNFVVVQGENGSGKSHFIRWMKYKYDNELEDDSEISILIERNYNTLQGTIEQLLKNEVIQQYVNKEDLSKLSDAGSSISTKKFLSDINSSFANAVLCEDDDDCILSKLNRKKLYAFLVNETVMESLLLKKGGPIDRIGKKLSSNEEGAGEVDNIKFTEEDFTFTVYGELLTRLNEEEADGKVIRCAEDFAADKKGFKGNVITYLNSKIEDVIQATIKLNTQDLNNMLFNIRSKLYEVNKNLTIFIEDITSFTGLDKAIIENLIIENTEENKICRLFSVVGITQGYYESSFPDNLKDRVTSRIIIDKDSILGTDDAILNIASRYLNAIYMDKKHISNWVKSGALDSELPIVSPKYEWSKFKDKFGREFNIYPFNKEAIINLFNSLKTKTPRMVISHVIYPLLIEMASGNPFPPEIDDIKDKVQVPEYVDQFTELKINKAIDGSERERLKTLIRIWGDGSIDSVEENGVRYLAGIREEIFNRFNVPFITGNQVISRREVAIPKVIKPIEESISHVKAPEVSTTVKKEVDKPKEKQIKATKAEKNESTEYKIMLEDLKGWITNNESLKSHSKFRDYVINFIKEAVFWEMEEVSQYLVEDTLNKTNIIIEGQNAKISSSVGTYMIKRNEENYYFLLSLLEYYHVGNRTWNFKGASERIILLSKWIEKNKESIINFIKAGSRDGYDLYSYALLNNYYVNCIIDDISKKKLYEVIINNKTNIHEEELRKVLSNNSESYLRYKDDIENNKEIVIRYFNCKLGDASVNTTQVFYLDAKEILERIEDLKNKNWTLPKTINVSLGERWMLPNKLYKTYVSENLINGIESGFKDIVSKVEKYKAIIGEGEEVNSTIIEIKKFYKNLNDANKFFDSNLYSNFEKIFLKEYRMNSIIKVVEDSKDKAYSIKVARLKQGIRIYVNSYLNIIVDIQTFIENSLRENEKANEVLKLEESLQNIKNDLFEDINEMISDLSLVDGGGSDVIK